MTANAQGLQVNIVSPEKTLFSGICEQISVPGELGTFEVLVNHAPIISTLTSGAIVCQGTTPFTLAVKGGFVEVAHNEVSVCVEV